MLNLQGQHAFAVRLQGTRGTACHSFWSTECDEVSDLIEAELNNSDDNFVVKAVKATALNRIKDGIRESVEKNKNDPVELAKTCKEFKLQFEKYKAEEEAKRNQNSR